MALLTRLKEWIAWPGWTGEKLIENYELRIEGKRWIDQIDGMDSMAGMDRREAN